MPAAPRRLFPVALDIALFTLSREPAGWRLAVRSGAAQERWMEHDPDVYEPLTLEEAADIIGAVLDGIEP